MCQMWLHPSMCCVVYLGALIHFLCGRLIRLKTIFSEFGCEIGELKISKLDYFEMYICITLQQNSIVVEDEAALLMRRK